MTIACAYGDLCRRPTVPVAVKVTGNRSRPTGAVKVFEPTVVPKVQLPTGDTANISYADAPVTEPALLQRKGDAHALTGLLYVFHDHTRQTCNRCPAVAD